MTKEIIKAMGNVRYFLVTKDTTREELAQMFNEKRGHLFGTNYVEFLPCSIEQIPGLEDTLLNKDEAGLLKAIRLYRGSVKQIYELLVVDMLSLEYTLMDVCSDDYEFRSLSETSVKEIILSEIKRLL